MAHVDYLEPAWVKGEQAQWSPTIKTILGFILSLLVLSPAVLGLYWEMILPK